MLKRICGVCNQGREVIMVTPDPRVKGAKTVYGFMCPKCDYMPRKA